MENAVTKKMICLSSYFINIEDCLRFEVCLQVKKSTELIKWRNYCQTIYSKTTEKQVIEKSLLSQILKMFSVIQMDIFKMISDIMENEAQVIHPDHTTLFFCFLTDLRPIRKTDHFSSNLYKFQGIFMHTSTVIHYQFKEFFGSELSE